MLGWFRRKPQYLLATTTERQAILAEQHPVFRDVDDAFHTYLEVITANPQWEDERVEQELIRRRIAIELAEECVTFGPMAWGREIAEQLGVPCSPLFRLHSMINGSERDLPLANEIVYAWARAMLRLYRTAERNEVFMLVAGRSAEVGAINNALHAGVSDADLRASKLQPSLVYFRRACAPGSASDA